MKGIRSASASSNAQKMSLSRRSRILFGTAVAGFGLGASPAFAQVAAEPASESSTDVGALQEIIVTAQKRSENVQDTPLSVTALSGEALRNKSVVKVEDLSRVDSALQISHTTGIVQTFVRGLGNPVSTAGNEASVPIYIDDVYFVRPAYPFLTLGSVDRVEVLKGPQGTLFGRNASAGVISIYTRNPDFSTPEMSGKVGVANYDTVFAQLYVNRPITNSLSWNLAFDGNRQTGGWGRNVATGDPTYVEHHVSVRSKLLWEPTDDTKVQLIGYYQRSYNEQGFNTRPFPGTVAGYPDGLHSGFPAPRPGDPTGLQPRFGFYDYNSDINHADKSDGYGGSVRIDQGIGFADLVSITALRRATELSLSDGDNSSVNYLVYALNILDRQFTQEFQLKSQPGSKLSWILGAFYLNAKQGFSPTTITGHGLEDAGLKSISLFGVERFKSYAGFGQATYPITENTNFTGGLRYTIDKVNGVGNTVVQLPISIPGVTDVDGNLPASIDGDFRKTFRKLTYKASIDHHFTDDIMAYTVYSRGYKAGTYNTLPLDAPALNPEIVDAYEVGLKTELFDRRVRVNGALFWNDVSDPQVQSNRNGFVTLLNAGSARTRGVEFDASALLTRGLTLNVGGTYLDATFRDFKNAPALCPSSTISIDQCAAILRQQAASTAAAGGNPAPILARIPVLGNGNTNQVPVDATGNRLPRASKIKLSAGLTYDYEAAFGKITVDTSVNYQSSFNWDADNVIKEPAHTFIDASIAIRPDSFNGIGLRFWVRNLTDVKYNVGYYANASGSAFSSGPGAPRTYGAEVLFKF